MWVRDFSMKLTSDRAVATVLVKIGRYVIMLILEVLPIILIPTLLLHKILGTHHKTSVYFSVLAT